MDFDFSLEQAMLRDSLSGYLADAYDFERRQQAAVSGPGWRPDVWKALAHDLGIFGATFSPDLGGLGGDAIEAMIVAEEFGKALVLEPYIDTIVVAGNLLKRAGGSRNDGLIERIIAGDAIFAFAYQEPQGRFNPLNVATRARRSGSQWSLSGHKSVVSSAAFATHYIVTARTSGEVSDPDGLTIFVVDASADGIRRKDYPTFDGGRASEVYFDDVMLNDDAVLGEPDGAAPLIEQVTDEAVAATCAEACGVIRTLLQHTIDYTRERNQFGKPLSSFQALQHRMVDMFIEVEKSVSLTYMATLQLSDPALRGKAVSAAKAQVAKACRYVGQNAVQLHGGMGVTDELALGHYFKRATRIETLYGSRDYHLARYEAMAFDQPA